MIFQQQKQYVYLSNKKEPASIHWLSWEEQSGFHVN